MCAAFSRRVIRLFRERRIARLHELKEQVKAAAERSPTVAASLSTSDRVQCAAACRCFPREWLHQRGNENAKRRAQDHASARIPRVGYLRAGAGLSCSLRRRAARSLKNRFQSSKPAKFWQRRPGLELVDEPQKNRYPMPLDCRRQGQLPGRPRSARLRVLKTDSPFGFPAINYSKARRSTRCRLRNCCSAMTLRGGQNWAPLRVDLASKTARENSEAALLS